MRTLSVIAAVILLILPVESLAAKAKPAAETYPRDETDRTIYREFEICMNSAKKQVADDKLGGQDSTARCMMQLKRYGTDRASKAFKFYFE